MSSDDEDRSNNSTDQTRRQREPRGNFVEDEDHFARDDTSILTNASSVRVKSKDANDDMTASKMEAFADIIAVAFVKANQHATKSSPSTKQTLGVTAATIPPTKLVVNANQEVTSLNLKIILPVTTRAF